MNKLKKKLVFIIKCTYLSGSVSISIFSQLSISSRWYCNCLALEVLDLPPDPPEIVAELDEWRRYSAKLSLLRRPGIFPELLRQYLIIRCRGLGELAAELGASDISLLPTIIGWP